eukprot:TRINITY_DN4857_c0_g1_i1.p1 TRINITY_DN4857_c0_g1~~TRINITY_DN4857_c0_g1_i1.p1  ORF type:complete len:385 (-),score=50.86 TRINITY_DN4857_c0_g1_i1:35-1189(-)
MEPSRKRACTHDPRIGETRDVEQSGRSPATGWSEDAKAAILSRHSREREDLSSSFVDSEAALKLKQQEQLTNKIAEEQALMEDRITKFRSVQQEEVASLKASQDTQRRVLTRKQMTELYSQFLRITSSKFEFLNGCYELMASKSSGIAPVYRKFDRQYFLRVASDCSWHIDVSGGVVTQGGSAGRCMLPALAKGWTYNAKEGPQPADLQVEELPEGRLELVVVSMAGNEILRKTLLPSATVAELQDDLRKIKGGERVKVSLRDEVLGKNMAVGCLNIGSGDVLHAVVVSSPSVECLKCKRESSKSKSKRCVDCSKYSCKTCARKCLKKCHKCSKRRCKDCSTRRKMPCGAKLCDVCQEEHECTECEGLDTYSDDGLFGNPLWAM